MSILLDALKKSEEQRRLGEAPSIHGPADHRPGGSSRRIPLWAISVLFFVAVLTVAGLAWKFLPLGEGADEVRDDTVSTAVTDSPAMASRQIAQSESVTVDEEANGEAGDKATHRLVESYRSPETRAGEKEQESSLARNTETDERRKALNQSFKQFQAPVKEEEAVLAEKDDAAETVSVASRPDPEPEPERSEPGPVSYWELPQSVRDDLPELRISVMVYAEEPKDRFLLVNGERIREGDTINGMVLDEIRRDGAVFRYRKYTFLLKG